MSRRPPLTFIFTVTLPGILSNTLVTPAIPDILDDFGRGSGAAGVLVAVGSLAGGEVAVLADPMTIDEACEESDLIGQWITDASHVEPYEKVPEASRRARAIPVWAALRSLGRSGVAALVDRLCRNATALAEGARGNARRGPTVA